MKKLLSVFLALAMLCGVPASLAEEPAAPVEITIVTKTIGNGTPEDEADDFVYQKILSDIGVAVHFVKLDDYYTALNARISGGDVPDIFYLDSKYLQTYVNEGLLMNLTPYMDGELSYLLNNWIQGADYNAQIFNGALYMLPKTAPANELCLNVRLDWLEKLGMTPPATLQELYDVAYAFTYHDPDGDGVNNTFGFSSQKGFYAYDTIALCFGCAMGNYVIIQDGKVTNTLLQPRMKDALSWCKKFVDDGLMDPENYTVSAATKAYEGSVGLLTNTWPGIYKAVYQEKFAMVNPKARMGVCGPLASEAGGEAVIGMQSPVNPSGYVVSSQISPEKLNAFFQFAHYITETEEGTNLIYYGLENEHWRREADGGIVMTENAAAANYISHYQVFGRHIREYLGVKFPEAKEAYEFALDANMMPYYNALVVEPEYMYLSDMESYVNTTLLEFIYGERPIEEYDDFIQELNDSYFFNDYMEAAALQLAAYGYVD